MTRTFTVALLLASTTVTVMRDYKVTDPVPVQLMYFYR